MRLVGQWGTYGGRPESADRGQEAYNRRVMSHRAVPISRTAIEIDEDGFDPFASNALCQWVPYFEHVRRIVEVGGLLELNIDPHWNGHDSGAGYHNRPAIVDPEVVSRFTFDVVTWLLNEGWLDSIHSASLGNEFGYQRVQPVSFEDYFEAWLAFESELPDNIVRISAGNSGLEFRDDGHTRTHNGEWASRGLAQEHGVVLMVHKNKDPIGTIYPDLRHLPDKYPGVNTGCNEDRPVYEHPDNDALALGLEAKRAGALYYGMFTARTTTELKGSPQQHDQCSWSVTGANTGSRANLGFESCWRKWNPQNYALAVALAQDLGSWIDGPILPVEINEGNGDPPQTRLEKAEEKLDKYRDWPFDPNNTSFAEIKELMDLTNGAARNLLNEHKAGS